MAKNHTQPSIFANAKILSSPTKAKKAEVEVEVPAGLKPLSLIRSLIKSLEGVETKFEEQVKGWARDRGIAEAEITKRKPENFHGFDGDAKASVQYRKPSTRVVLSDELVESLTADGISPETIEDVAETFIINPAYAGDSALLGKIENALKKIPGLPADFILKQEGKSRKVVSDDVVSAVFAKGLAKKYFDLVCCIAVKPTLETPDLKEALELAKKFVK